MKPTRRIRVLILAVALVAGVGHVPHDAHALSPTVRSIIVGGIYGAVAGTGLGLISYPFSGQLRTVLMGSSIGLYLGMAAGGYHAQNRSSPQNPFNLSIFNERGITGRDGRELTHRTVTASYQVFHF